MRNSRTKKILFFLLGIFLTYTLWLGIQLARFQSYAVSEPDLENTPLEIQGAYHIHTTHSDGRKKPDKIAELASRTSLDFIILTDHGDPNLESLAEAGWSQGILVLAGSELSVSRGHLVALSFKSPTRPFSQNAERAAYQIKTLDGFSIIAHPYSKVSWSWGEPIGYEGMEIINANTLLKYDFFRIFPFLPSLLIKPEYAMLKMLRRPDKNLKKWDELNHSHPTYGFYSVDAHIMYKHLLPFLQLHVLLTNPLSKEFDQASHQIFAALRRGRFYNAVDSAAQANGFRFWAQKGQKKILMGEESFLDSNITLHIHAEFPFSCEIHMIHDGKNIMTSFSKRIAYQPTQTGFYRVEVYLQERTPMHSDIPWILSNPIFFREKTS